MIKDELKILEELLGEEYHENIPMKRHTTFKTGGNADIFISPQTTEALAESMGVPVCDCYGMWKKLAETRDITALLANRINHPTREMHELFAQALFEMILPEEAEKGKTESTMQQK